MLKKLIELQIKFALVVFTLLFCLMSIAFNNQALAQTFAPDAPILGGASYCFTLVNNVCQATIPAGPAATGLETVPADTNVGNSGVQAVKVPIISIGGGILTYNAPLTGASITLTNVTKQLIVEPAGTIAALTIVMPVATGLINGQELGICGTQIVTTLTMTAGTGTTLANAPTAMLVPVATGAGSCFAFIYRSANTTWYRVQ